MFKIFVFLSKRRISGGVNWSLPFQFLLFRKLPITPRKSFLNSHRTIPEIQVFQLVIFEQNIQFLLYVAIQVRIYPLFGQKYPDF